MAMPIEITSNCILRPSLQGHRRQDAEVVSMPLNLFDKAAGNLHFPTLLAFRNFPPNQDFANGLSMALDAYPHMAGRIARDPAQHNRLSFILNNAGVRLVEAEVPKRMDDNTLLDDIAFHKNLYPPATRDTQEMLQVQLSRYACGGLVIGITFCHPVADGQSMGQFLQAVASATRGAGTGPTPFLDRNSLFVPNDPPRVKFDHLEVHSSGRSSLPMSSSGVENLVIQFSGEFIAQLKERVSFRATTFEVLLAHLWRRAVQVRGLPDDETTRVRVAVNGRSRMRPVVPPEYFGNLVLWALAKASAGDLLREGLSGAVGHIRKAVKRMDDEYYRSAIDFGAVLEKEGREEETLLADEEDWGHHLYPDLEVDSWLGFRFNEADFGRGPPCAVVPPNLPIEGVMAFISSAKGKGGVDAFLTVRKEHVEDFKRICKTLD